MLHVPEMDLAKEKQISSTVNRQKRNVFNFYWRQNANN